ncbi:reverse transcriptase domain-containing protein [Tanacetum coccineum]|uniref:Reverse transcriptase domain-containing protein n=1 Tax=Tanacetum coccineum TaxID=301880 RepID=A0ABQ5EKB4_9ASTR
MPPRRFKKKSVKRIVEKRVAKAIEEYEKTRTDSNNAGGSGSANTGGTVAPEMHGCSYKTFTNGKPHSFNGTEGVVGLKRWFEKMEQVFEICKCAEDDKVKFAMCTFEGRALTWWNGNVQTLGLANANQIPWSNVKAMMTTEYCPATEIHGTMTRNFINQFFPPSKTTNLRNEITSFQQRFDESFSEAWDRFKDLLRACPHHGFSELQQLNTFYNALNSNDQDSLNSAAGGNFLDKMPHDCLAIIERKSKVRYKAIVSKVNMSSSTPGVSPDVAELKDLVRALLLDKKNQS